MRHTKRNRGQMRVIEVLLASFIIISALSFVTTFAATPTSPRLETSDLEKMGHNALLDLDHHGLLVPLVYGQSSQNWSDLRTLLKITMPVDVYFNLTIYRADSIEWIRVSGDKIIYGDEETFDSSKNIASVSYVLIGYQSGYDPRILLLQLSRG